MLYNFGKCKCLHRGHGNLDVNYKMGDTVLGTTVKEKDLGITISADLKVSEQCGIGASQGNTFLGLVRRNIRYKELDLTRFAIQAKGPDGKWTRKPLAYRESNNVHLLITRPPEICVNLVFKHIHAASSYTICRQFVPFIYCPL